MADASLETLAIAEHGPGRALPLATGVNRGVLIVWLLIALAVTGWALTSDMPGAILAYWKDITFLTVQHLELVAWSGGLAVLTGIVAGSILSRPAFRGIADIGMQVFNLGATIPTLAILALSITLLGIGTVPAIFGLWAITLLPIVSNTYAGLRAVPAYLIDAAIGMGMSPWQVFWRVELPNALFVMFSGIRTGLAICIGSAPLVFLVGAGGLGELIFTGISLDDLPMMLAGAIPTALIAVIIDFLVGLLQFYAVPRGINPLR